MLFEKTRHVCGPMVCRQKYEVLTLAYLGIHESQEIAEGTVQPQISILRFY